MNALSANSSIAFKQLETVADPSSKSGFKTKICPKTMNTENQRCSRQDSSSTKRSSSRESSDFEGDGFVSHKYKNEEKSQLICYKDNVKILSFKNDSRLTKYSTFDINVADKRGKYRSLDEPRSKTLIKYVDTQNNISMSAQDFTSDFKLSKFDHKRNKHDLITETVDAWAKKNNKGMLSNIKNSLFHKSNSTDKQMVFKPLVFGGTFPIDRPEKVNSIKGKVESRMVMNQSPKMREYGPPKTFNIDQPI